MKQTESFEEESLLPSRLFDEEYITPKKIETNQTNFELSPERKNQNYENKFFDSNFLGPNNSNLDLKEETSEETEDTPKKKQEFNFKNYLNYAKSSNDILEPGKNDINGDEEINWSQINSDTKNENESSESNQNGKNVKVIETKEINKVKEFSYVNSEEDIDNGYDGTLNNFIYNFSNDYFFNNKNNHNINERQNYDLNNLSNEQNSLNEGNNGCKTGKNIIIFNNIFVNNINIIYCDNQSNNFSNNEELLFDSDNLPNYLKNSENNYINPLKNNSNNQNQNNLEKILLQDSNAIFEEEKIEQAQTENSVNKNNNYFDNIENVIVNDNQNKAKRSDKKDFEDFIEFCKTIKTSLLDYICSKEGNRIFINFLNEYNPLKINYLIRNLHLNFELIICDKFGSYFFKILYRISSNKYRMELLYYIKDIFDSISKDKIGSHVIKKMIEVMETEVEKNMILDFIKGKEMELSLDKEGTRIIQKIILIFPEKDRQSLTDIICIPKNLEKLLDDKNGVLIIKKLISFNQDINNKRKLMEALYPNIRSILKTSNGCYIIYYLIEQWGVDIGINFVYILIFDIETFSEYKWPVKLIDKILKILRKINGFNLYNNNNIYTISNCNNILLLLKSFKELLFEPIKLAKIYASKYGKHLTGKILSLFSEKEKKTLNMFIMYLKSGRFYCDNNILNIYLNLLNNHCK